ncbi:MAG TPA: hypothetical protein VF613_20950 [Longimicrobium sp.]|jgi:hypothetical protein
MLKSDDSSRASRPGGEPAGETVERGAVRLKRIVEDTQRVLDYGTGPPTRSSRRCDPSTWRSSACSAARDPGFVLQELAGMAESRPVRPRSHTPIGRLPDAWTECLVRTPATALKHLGAHAEWFSAAETVGKIRMYEAVIPRANLEALIYLQELWLALRHLRPDPGYAVPVLRKGRTHVAILVGNPLLVGIARWSGPRIVK